MQFSEQEVFWAGSFGDEYIFRNESASLLAANVSLFSEALRHAQAPASCLEIGANVGLNLKALASLYPNIDLTGVEINSAAHAKLAKMLGDTQAIRKSVLQWTPERTYDLVLSKTILIHINPDKLQDVYGLLHKAARRYILVCEYYSPNPCEIDYRGHSGKLFKRDFAGEMLDSFADLTLLDYGFRYRRDRTHPQDDINWFLLQKHIPGSEGK